MFLFALIDPNWAVPLNTGLLIVLAFVNTYQNRRQSKRTDKIHKQVVDTKIKCGADRREEDLESIQEITGRIHTANPTDPPTPTGRRFTDAPDENIDFKNSPARPPYYPNDGIDERR